jgi:hypothetical protein
MWQPTCFWIFDSPVQCPTHVSEFWLWAFVLKHRWWINDNQIPLSILQAIIERMGELEKLEWGCGGRGDCCGAPWLLTICTIICRCCALYFRCSPFQISLVGWMVHAITMSQGLLLTWDCLLVTESSVLVVSQCGKEKKLYRVAKPAANELYIEYINADIVTEKQTSWRIWLFSDCTWAYLYP